MKNQLHRLYERFVRLAGKLPKPETLSGSASLLWATALDIPLAADERPRKPSLLRVSLRVSEGAAGLGWYDNAGLAEEIFLDSSPDLQTVALTVWRPQECMRLIVRSVLRGKMRVAVESLQWIPIKPTTLNRSSSIGVDRAPEGFFLDQAFAGQPAEVLWRAWRDKRFDESRKLRALQRLVQTAWHRCPGYGAFWESHGWHPSMLRTLNDINDVPTITKDIIASNPQAFAVPRPKLAEFTTSGTTGSPFSFKYTPALNAAHSSAVAIAATFGDPARSPWQQKALIIRRSLRGASATGAGGSLIVNAADVHDRELMRQLIDAYQPTIFFGWPSYVGSIAQAVSGGHRFRLAILGSENIFDSQIEEAGRIAQTVVGTYGLSEGAGFAMRCPACGTYAELDTHGVISLDSRLDGMSEMIGTSFWSRGTLFIRYATGDLTSGETEPCPHCPSSMLHFRAPQGRSQEFILDGRGRRHALAMIVGAEKFGPLLKSVELFDFVQFSPGEAVFRYVSTDRLPIEEEQLIAEFRKLVRDEIALTCRHDTRLLDLRRELSSSRKWSLLKKADF